ncbi:CarD family transcriptional regulator [Siminovitchia sediminis]|uniref:CarD family transcriptional regulator n=1 Tax=Siminovitchia sediminis TaxID=1274353 RepID=A0ABW4KN06_9BACI
MIEVGDKVFYPMHGAGIVKAIDNKDFRGKVESYCLITIPSKHMDVMLPVEKASKAGLRPLVDRNSAKKMLQDYYQEENDSDLPWKKRYNANLEKIKTGDFRACLEVVNDLLHRGKEKPLNGSEKQMLHQAKRLVGSELALIKDISEKQAEKMLELPN